MVLATDQTCGQDLQSLSVSRPHASHRTQIEQQSEETHRYPPRSLTDLIRPHGQHRLVRRRYLRSLDPIDRPRLEDRPGVVRSIRRKLSRITCPILPSGEMASRQVEQIDE